MKTYWNCWSNATEVGRCFCCFKASSTKVHVLFGAQEISVVLNTHIFCCSEMYSCLHEKGWGTNITASKHKEVPCPSEACHELWKQPNFLIWKGHYICVVGRARAKRFWHFSIAWDMLWEGESVCWISLSCDFRRIWHVGMEEHLLIWAYYSPYTLLATRNQETKHQF